MTSCTVITVWNDARSFHTFKEDLSRQKDVAITLIDIDNRNNQFPGIRQALNSQIDAVESDIVVCMHQDIRFLHDNALRDFLEKLTDLGDFGVAGVAGCPEGTPYKLLSNIVHGEDMRPAGIKLQAAVKVQSIDECAFAMRTEVLRNMRFSELEGWHLYAVEQCLRATALGLDCYVVPADLYHISDGKSLDPSYLTSLIQLARRYDVDRLNTTVKKWRLRSLSGRLYIGYYYLKQLLKRCLLRLSKR